MAHYGITHTCGHDVWYNNFCRTGMASVRLK